MNHAPRDLVCNGLGFLLEVGSHVLGKGLATNGGLSVSGLGFGVLGLGLGI